MVASKDQKTGLKTRPLGRAGPPESLQSHSREQEVICSLNMACKPVSTFLDHGCFLFSFLPLGGL